MQLMDEAIQEFINECTEMLERISMTLTDIESTGPSPDKYSSIYRDIHTIKGSAQLFGFNQIGTLAHAMEATLDPIRKGRLQLSSDLVDLILKGLDHIHHILETVKKDRREGDFQKAVQQYIPRLVDTLTLKYHKPLRLLRDEFADYEILPKENPEQLMPEEVARLEKENKDPAPSKQVALEQVPAPDKASEHTTAPAVVTAAPTQARMETPARSSASVALRPSKSTDERPAPTAAVAAENQDTIRVQVTVLDKLMNLAGELVLVRNQMLRYSSVHARKNPELSRLSQKINAVTSEIQNEVMKTRMQPIGSILSKFNRMIRDLSRDLDKKIELKLEGTETELDKALIEAVKDPLTHIIRNSADHGIELPSDRIARNKPEHGTITVRSYHEGGQVVIEISDDGRGLNRKKIIEKAIEKSIITAEEGRLMSDPEAWKLIFAAGFSTADQVSSISGRGVGMDVVKTNIEKIGGVIELDSVQDQGTTLLLKIPLTLAIVPALVIRTGGIRLAIPQVKLLEVLRVSKSSGSQQHLEYIHDKPVYRLRGQLLPLIDLQEFLSVPSQRSAKSLMFDEDMASIVVLKSGSSSFGIIVDEIEDNADIVVKPIPLFLKNVGIYVGATVLGDGSVALALDVAGIAEKAQLSTSNDNRKALDQAAQEHQRKHSTLDYIVFDIGDQGHYVLPMNLVNRLEEFKNSRFEYAGNKKLIQYRDKLLPIVMASDYFRELSPELQTYSQETHQLPADAICPVIVLQIFDRLIGLQVRRIVDIVGIDSNIDDSLKIHHAIHGTLIHKNRIYTVLDAYRVIRDALNIQGNRASVQNAAGQKLLIVEDSDFFRKHMERLLTEAGYQVRTAQNGQEALDLLEASPGEYSLVISDIEMPVLDGFGLAQKIRATPTLNRLPLIAVTTRYRQADIDHGEKVGFVAYLEKLNEEHLVDVVRNILSQEGA
jgi:two-component system chemotaxis sensor kinase CheA